MCPILNVAHSNQHQYKAVTRKIPNHQHKITKCTPIPLLRPKTKLKTLKPSKKDQKAEVGELVPQLKLQRPPLPIVQFVIVLFSPNTLSLPLLFKPLSHSSHPPTPHHDSLHFWSRRPSLSHSHHPQQLQPQTTSRRPGRSRGRTKLPARG